MIHTHRFLLQEGDVGKPRQVRDARRKDHFKRDAKPTNLAETSFVTHAA